MNKICTDIKQSKKLVELGIDIKTADMHYMYRHWEIDENTIGSQSDASIGFDSDFYCGANNSKTYHYIPAWSLTALLKLIQWDYKLEKTLFDQSDFFTYSIVCDDLDYRTFEYGNEPLDAAFEMVCWLKENEKI